jgi:subtilisin family serine protease
VQRIDHGRTRDALDQIGLTGLHGCGYDGSGVLVCVLDDGFTFHDTHEALRDQPIGPGRRRDFVDGDTTVTNPSGAGLRHGTAVLGLIGGNRFGSYVGAAFGAEFALARTENDFVERPVEMLYWGMGAEWADSLGADIITSSVGYFQFDDPDSNYTYADMDGRTTVVSQAARIAARKGILVVNAVGNVGNQSWRFVIAPADVDGDSLIAVGAVNANGDTVSFSSAGPTADGRIKPDLVALGLNDPILLAGSDPGAYTAGAGTSFAAPLVSGLAACLMQAHPQWTPHDVILALRTTASRADHPDHKMGYGIPDAVAASRWPDIGGDPTAGSLELRLLGPNPLRPAEGSARLELALGAGATSATEARVRVRDLLGRTTRDVWSGTLCLGQRPVVTWDGRDDGGRRVRSGLYWVSLEGGGQRRAVRLVTLE